MNGNMTRAVFTLAAGMVLFSSCGLGLSPLGKDDSSQTAVSLSLASLGVNATGNVSRAVMPGTDFLYIRTIGISGKTTGALYGPYSVAVGSTFVTTDIPSGEYERMYVLCSGKDLENGETFSFFGGAYTFHDLMSLPDTQMKEFISDETEKSSLDSLLDGQVSFGQKDAVTIMKGKENSLSLTLIPITSKGYELELGSKQSYSFSSSSRARHFYRLGGIKVSLPVTTGTLSCTISAASASAGTLSGMALFSSTGAEIPVTKDGSDLASGFTWTIDSATINSIANSDGNVELYQYLDYSGDLSAKYRNTAGGNTASGVLVSFDGDPTASYQGHRLLVALYDTGAAVAVASGVPWENLTALGYAIIPLDATSGDGSLLVSASVTPGATYYISAQVDTGDHYASLTSLDSVDIATIVPYQGDYLTNGTNGLIPFTGGQTVSLRTSDFVPYTDYVYFVAQGGDPLIAGATPATPTTLENALALITDILPSDSAQIYLCGSLSGQGTMNISRNVFISAYGSSPCTIAADSTSLGAIPYIRIDVDGALSLEKVSIDCSLLTGNPDSLIYLPDNANSSLYMGYGSSLIGGAGYTPQMHGGGVYVGTGCDLVMQGSSIQNCSLLSMTGSAGAAVYVAAGGSATLQNATFANNSTNSIGLGIVYTEGTVYAKSLVFQSNSGSDYFLGSGGTWNLLP